MKYKIRVPGAVDATRTVVIRYRAANGLRFLEEHDELYWNITGDEWDVPIEAASARIVLPAAATGVRAIAFNGAYGSTARDAVVKTEGTTVRVTMPHRLDFHEGLTAVVGWNKGLVAQPTDAQEARRIPREQLAARHPDSGVPRDVRASGAGSAAIPSGGRSRCSTSRPNLSPPPKPAP